ncbi:putative Co-chaperone protein hscB like protein [Monoraphidium neglectum]|uniref:Putative Co-chaperone protein hscB like protein n=1 Tax=Monoraphidium neglectum TaxID=145388 RepID=A0A0D2JKW4_9CHLO|nr:putative Co-chaperone protein hscB like protein [Monoraphidium neglectum]KIY99902.1 putative Co-chaperone protein hscB like protein [Monoraphidium neglectum]|eukprot:XP_013898922.1 putative Co-chaperone protein hscB like protein [Monoraphidium neglectum]
MGLLALQRWSFYKQPTFDIDEASLERRYKLLQWTLHPDKAVSRTAEEQDFSAGHASQINQAYGVLRRSLSRANYLLMLAGVPAGDHFEGTLEDPELLMEVMEARERVEGTSDPSELRELLAANRSDQRRVEGQLSAAFGAGDTARAAALVAQLTYYVRLEEAIVAKL